MRSVALVLTFLLLAGGPARAQTSALGGQSGSQGDAATSIKFGQIVEALGRWIVRTVQPDEEPPTVDAPRWNATGAPRETVMTFLENVEYLRRGQDEAWPRVRATLPVREDLATRAKALDLARVFDRLGEVSSFRLASAELAEREGLRRYRVFPGALDHEPVWQALDGAPDGRIVLELHEDGSWRFGAETMAGIGRMLESMAAIPPRSAHPLGELDLPPLFDLNVPPDARMNWWIATAFLVVAMAAGFGARWAMVRGAGLARRRKRRIAAAILEQLASPVLGALVLVGVVLASSTFALHPAVSSLRWQLTGLLSVLVLGFFLYRLVPVFGETLGGATGNSHIEGTAVPLLVRILQVLLVGMIVVVLLDGLFSVNLAGLVAGFGILGLALGLAAQESVRNWFGALTIYLARPFTKGDWILYRDDFAQVEEIGLNATKLRLASGEQLTVPNMKFIDQEVQNLTERPYLRREMDLAFPYDTSAEGVDEILAAVKEAFDDDDVREEGHFEELEREPHVSFHAFADDHLVVRVYYWFQVEPGETGWYDYLAHCGTVNRALLQTLEARGIQFAFPTRTLRLVNEDDDLRVSADVQPEDEGSD